MSSPSGSPNIEAALGLRARAGSREALLRAAFDLVDTSSSMQVHDRSLIWHTADDPSQELVAAIRIAAQADIAGLEAAVGALADRLCPPALGLDALRVELLWAHDPQGVPRVAANPPPDLEPERPPLPDGEIYLHPEVPTRASACTPLSQVAGHARDPVTTRFVSEFLYTVPEPYGERPEPFRPAFQSERRAIDGGRIDSLVARDRADLLAAAAELFVGAPASAMPIYATTSLPDPSADARISVTVPPQTSLGERVLRWLHAVEQVVVGDQLAVRRVVVIDDGAQAIHGLLFGARSDSPISIGHPHDAIITVDPATGVCRAELTVLDR
jgi:hypothetical protein